MSKRKPAPAPSDPPAAGGLFGGLGPTSPLQCRVPQKELAAALGVAPKTLWQWGRDRHFPPAQDGGYVLRDVLGWLAAAAMDKGGLGGGEEKLSLKEKKLKADIAMLELKMEKLADKYVDRAQCEAQMAIAGAVLAKRLQAIGGAYGPEVSAALRQALAECEAQTRQALAGESDEEGAGA